MKKALFISFAIAVIAIVISRGNPIPSSSSPAIGPKTSAVEASPMRNSTIIERVSEGEALYDIFVRQGLNIDEMYSIVAASKKIYDIGRIAPGRELILEVEDKDRVLSLTYNIDSDNVLNIKRSGKGFAAEKTKIPYETSLVHISGTVKDNLVSSIDDLLLALDLSDIFAWDIDFTTDIREGDSFKIVVEERRLDGEFVKYGNILSAEFINNGRTYQAYRFEQNGRTDYFDGSGKSLKKAFLKAPLSFRRISSGYTKNRFHPVLKVYRPHLGVDYAAPRGTPVSTVGDGTVLEAGRKGGNGNYVMIKHLNGYITYYLHLHQIAKGIRKGARVRQGQVIGTVGSTGYATGPHLDYRVKVNGKFVNPLTLKLPPGEPVKKNLLGEFASFRDNMNSRLATILPIAASTPTTRKRS